MKDNIEKALAHLQVAYSLASREGGQGIIIASKIQSAMRQLREAQRN